MKPNDLPPPSIHRQNDGIAIIIVLAFVVLLTGLVVAFFSRTASDLQVSSNSIGQTKADLLARSAVDIIQGELKQEIVLNSFPVTGGTVYLPKSGTDTSSMLPVRIGNPAFVSGSDPIPNLIRRTVAGGAPVISSSASAVSTTGTSLNGRSMSVNRWFSPYLIPSSGTANFIAPDWVMVTNTGPAVLTSPTSSVVGRYAYVIYDEGGLLDINVAGYPASGAAQYSGKEALSYADLTQLPQLSNSNAIVEKIVAWRNASATGSSAYHDYVVSATNGFLTVSGSDQAFTSRQALLKFWKANSYPTDALQYLGTFSRGLDQPSLITDLSPGYNETTNPAFLKIRTNEGDPLVQKRFPLSRLNLVAFNATGSTSDPVSTYFGLTRTGTTGAWIYRSGTISTLASVASESPERSPNFFELLKASITAGSLGKTALSTSPAAGFESYQYNKDTNIDYQILQIGANIIDQYDADSYPTWIQFSGATGSSAGVHGIENLPYLYRVRNAIVKAALPDPDPSDPSPVVSSTLTATGATIAFLQPEVWNPHDANSISLEDPDRPTAFRFVVDSGVPDLTGVIASASFKVKALSRGDGTVSAQYSDNADVPSSLSTDITLTPESSQINFSDANGSLYREPTLLSQPSTSGSVSLTVSSTTSVPYLSAGGVPDMSGSSGSYLGIYLGAAPLRWLKTEASGTTYVLSADKIAPDLGSPTSPGMTFHLQYKDSGNNWVDYDVKASPIQAIGVQTVMWPSTNNYGLVTGNESWGSCIDPRASRFGMPVISGSLAPVAGSTDRPDSSPGVSMSGTSAYGLPSDSKWYPGGWTATSFNFGLYSENSPSNAQHYADPDGVVRRAAGAYTRDLTGTTLGLPMAVGSNSPNRPVILNRPFRSVAELAYAFSGTPWRNLDMFTVESGFSGLLDVFSLVDTRDDSGLVAGRVNLNTRQVPVLQAILAGAYQDVLMYSPGTGGTKPELTGALASAIATKLVARTTGTASGQGPLVNLRQLVGRWSEAVSASGGGTDGSQSYKGFSGDLSDSTIYPTADAGRYIQRYREASVRALANVGNTRVWNLMIDLVAQSGRYPTSAASGTDLTKFLVEGEQRYWVHLAIDRFTGRVIDKQIEVVKE